MSTFQDVLSSFTLDDWHEGLQSVQAFDNGVRPTMQRPMQSVQGNTTQYQWITCTCQDESFVLQAWQIDTEGKFFLVDQFVGETYEYFWDGLASLKLNNRKWWLIGFRMRYALQQADMLGALERGDVHFASKSTTYGPRKRVGKITLTKTCVEIDIKARRNKVKILDWEQLGIMPGSYCKLLADLTPLVMETVLRDYWELRQILGVVATKVTSAQIGYTAFRKYFAPPTLSVNMDNDAREFERKAYYGGRNEPFRLGQMPETTYSLDVNSCYGHVCERETMPTRLLESYPLGCKIETIEANGDSHWFAEVLITTDKAWYPLTYHGQVIFPTGTFRTFLPWPELKLAIFMGHARKILKAHRYKADYVFKKYAMWYQTTRALLKAHRLAPIASVIKSMFNASLGYTARRKYELQPWNTQIGYKWWLGITTAPNGTGDIVHAQILDGEKQWLMVGGEPKEAMPFLHATICSYARRNLVTIIRQAGQENVYYCDTDGILVNGEGLNNLELHPAFTGSKPGELSERFEHGLCYINGQKNYRLGKNTVCAGLVHARHCAWEKHAELSTPTGTIQPDGTVKPFHFQCEDTGSNEAWYQNRLC